MNQFFIPKGFKTGDFVSLPPQEARHLRDVQRRTVGESIQVTDGNVAHYAQITTLSKQEAVVRLLNIVRISDSRSLLTIAPALLKGDAMEWVLEKCVELGVDTIQPFTSRRTIAEKESAHKRQRWEKIVDAAVKQCGTPTRPDLAPTGTFDKILELPADVKILFWEEKGMALRDLRKESVDAPGTRLLALIGPEGGFTSEEAKQALERGFNPVFLGHRILRAETAAIAAASLIQYEWGNL